MPFPKKKTPVSGSRFAPRREEPAKASRFGHPRPEPEEEDEEEDYTPRRKRIADETPAPRRKTADSDEGFKPAKSGWDKVKDKKAEQDMSMLNEFYLKDGEDAIIQFLEDEPYVFVGHRIKTDKKAYTRETCQLETQKHCLMCQAGIRDTNFAAFRIRDYRGKWDKKSGDYLWDKPREMFYVMSISLAEQLHTFSTKHKKELSEMVIAITRSGGGTDTRYNLERATNEDGSPMIPRRFKPEFAGTTQEALAPKSDDTLIRMGFEAVKD